MRRTLLAASTLVALATAASAQGTFTSAYTTIDFEKDCTVVSENDEGASITMRCKGWGSHPVNYAEGDLRAAVTFGQQPAGYEAPWQSFGPFNRINKTVEWRLKGDQPVATILRWFIDNMNPDTGAADPNREGNVLVVSRLAGLDGKPGCMVGVVDARANSHANEIARRIADTLAEDFDCTADKPEYHGERGPYSPDPT